MKILKLGERLTICGLDVVVSHTSGYFLNYIDGSNTQICEKIKVNQYDLQAEVLGYKNSGDFPFCKSLEDLTKFASAIQVKFIKQISVKETSIPSNPDYTIDLSPEKIKKDSKINNFILLNL
jgi:hypothetical protein